MDRFDRRSQFAEIDTKSMERFGHLCSPFQALQVVVCTLIHDSTSRLMCLHSSTCTCTGYLILLAWLEKALKSVPFYRLDLSDVVSI